MACALTQGYDFNKCKGGAGGIKRVLITEAANITAFTLTANVITAMTLTTGKQFREYKLDAEMGMAESPMTGDPKTDNITYAHKVAFTLKKFTTLVAAELKLIASNWTVVIVEDRNGKYRAYGLGTTLAKSNFLQMVSHGDATGTAMADFNGFADVTLQSIEDNYAYEANSSIITALLSPAT
jgi:hypothetical protein